MKLDPRLDWQKQYDTQTLVWREACRHRWEQAEKLLICGYTLAIARPLTKVYLSSGVGSFKNPITSLATLRTYTADGAKFFNHNYGVITGTGTCTVVDLDRKQGKEGLKAFQALGAKENFEISPGAIVITPSGGRHMYFAYAEGACGSAVMSSQGIDILNSDGDRPNARAIGPGSVIDDRKRGITGVYHEDETRGFDASRPVAEFPLPEEFVSLLETGKGEGNVIAIGTGKPLYAKGNRGNEHVEEVSPDEIAHLLSHLPVEELEYQDWLKVGMALHSWNQEQGCSVWDAWSAKDPREGQYAPEEIQKKWDSFGEGRAAQKVTLGTLYYLAQAAGWEPSKPQETEAYLSKMAEESPLVMLSEPKYLRVDRDGALVFHSLPSLKLIHANKRVEHAGKLTNPVDVFNIWHGRPEFDNYALYPPGGPECPSHILNTWRGYAVEPEEGDISLFLELFDLMFDSELREWIHDWFAHFVQRTGEKIDTALVLKGAQGTGKNTLMQVFQRMLKPRNSTQFINTSQFVSGFNDFVTQSALVLVNEAVWSGNHSHGSILKGYISEEEFRSEEKFQTGTTRRNCARFVVMSNDAWAVPAEKGSRRYCVAEVLQKRTTYDPWWGKVRENLRQRETVAAVMHFYGNRTITNNLHQVPQNSSLHDQQRRTMLKNLPADEHICLDVMARIIFLGKAAYKEVCHTDGDVLGHMIANVQIKRAYLYATDKTMPVAFLATFRTWLEQVLAIRSVQGLRVRHGGKLAHVFVFPPLDDTRKKIVALGVLSAADLDGPDEWTADGLEW